MTTIETTAAIIQEHETPFLETTRRVRKTVH